jgi:ArsR family transcriptional regulator
MIEVKSIDEQTLKEATAILKALADPNRLRILDALMQGDSCNCELNDRLGINPSLLSHHLGVLRQAGLVNSRRDAVDGRWIYYAVDREAVARWRAWFDKLLDPARIQERSTLCGPEGSVSP